VLVVVQLLFDGEGLGGELVGGGSVHEVKPGLVLVG